MTPYTLDELIERWNRGQFAEVQVITHLLQHVLAQELRLQALERRLEPPSGNGSHEGSRNGRG